MVKTHKHLDLVSFSKTTPSKTSMTKTSVFLISNWWQSFSPTQLGRNSFCTHIWMEYKKKNIELHGKFDIFGLGRTLWVNKTPGKVSSYQSLCFDQNRSFIREHLEWINKFLELRIFANSNICYYWKVSNSKDEMNTIRTWELAIVTSWITNGVRAIVL